MRTQIRFTKINRETMRKLNTTRNSSQFLFRLRFVNCKINRFNDFERYNSRYCRRCDCEEGACVHSEDDDNGSNVVVDDNV